MIFGVGVVVALNLSELWLVLETTGSFATEVPCYEGLKQILVVLRLRGVSPRVVVNVFS